MGKRGPKPGTGGVPVKEVDWARAEQLASIYCPARDIADILNLDVGTIDRACKRVFGKSFADWADSKRGNTRAAIRNKQIEVALAGDKVMLIWLGKQMLGQTDRRDLMVGASPDSGVIHLHFQQIEQMTQEQRLAEITRLRQLRASSADE